MATGTNTKKPNPYEKQGFDFDPELIDLFDAILQNINDEGELKEEFQKLKFIKQLNGTYNSRPGPLKQLIEKMGVMEHEFTKTKIDMQRTISDLNETIRIIKNVMDARNQEELSRQIDKLRGVQARTDTYTWNQNGK